MTEDRGWEGDWGSPPPRRPAVTVLLSNGGPATRRAAHDQSNVTISPHSAVTQRASVAQPAQQDPQHRVAAQHAVGNCAAAALDENRLWQKNVASAVALHHI